MLEDISPDPTNVDAATLAGLTFTSSAGRAVGLAGGPDVLYAVTENSGVWRSIDGDAWAQLPRSPAQHAKEGTQIATEQEDHAHVVTCNFQGAWESHDAGTTWSQVYDPVVDGCGSPRVIAVAFGLNGALCLGTDFCIATRQPGSTGFASVYTPGMVTAFAVSETKIWARTPAALLVSLDNGQTWSAPIDVPSSFASAFDYFAWFSLAALDAFAYLPFSTPGTTGCGSDVKILIYNTSSGTWTPQNVTVLGAQECDGTGLGGRKFVRSFIREGPGLQNTVGERFQLFYGSGQRLLQAQWLGGDGQVADWALIAATDEGSGQDVHADIWDFAIDTAIGGSTAWIADDGGVSVNTPAVPYQFPGGGWRRHIKGLHTQQLHTITVLPTTFVQSRLAYPTGDNEAWCRDSTWQAVAAGGDVNFSVGDAGLPQYALLARHREAATLKHFGGVDQVLIKAINGKALLNYKKEKTVGPDGPTLFQFIQAPKGAGSATLDAVMLVDLPLTYWDGTQDVPFDPTSPLGQSSNGLPVLIRNHDFAASPDINTSRGAGWSIELGRFPAGTEGFYVTGTPAAPVYYAFGTVETAGIGLPYPHYKWTTLWKWNGTRWLPLRVTGLRRSPTFGPAFVNPYDQNVLFVITEVGIQVSTDGGGSFAIDALLSRLIAGARGLPMDTLAHMAFNFFNPSEIAAVTVTGGVFFNDGVSGWKDLTGILPTPPTPLVAVGIDNERIYVATDGRSLLSINRVPLTTVPPPGYRLRPQLWRWLWPILAIGSALLVIAAFSNVARVPELPSAVGTVLGALGAVLIALTVILRLALGRRLAGRRARMEG